MIIFLIHQIVITYIFWLTQFELLWWMKKDKDWHCDGGINCGHMLVLSSSNNFFGYCQLMSFYTKHVSISFWSWPCPVPPFGNLIRDLDIQKVNIRWSGHHHIMFKTNHLSGPHICPTLLFYPFAGEGSFTGHVFL